MMHAIVLSGLALSHKAGVGVVTYCLLVYFGPLDERDCCISPFTGIYLFNNWGSCVALP